MSTLKTFKADCIANATAETKAAKATVNLVSQALAMYHLHNLNNSYVRVLLNAYSVNPRLLASIQKAVKACTVLNESGDPRKFSSSEKGKAERKEAISKAREQFEAFKRMGLTTILDYKREVKQAKPEAPRGRDAGKDSERLSDVTGKAIQIKKDIASLKQKLDKAENLLNETNSALSIPAETTTAEKIAAAQTVENTASDIEHLNQRIEDYQNLIAQIALLAKGSKSKIATEIINLIQAA